MDLSLKKIFQAVIIKIGIRVVIVHDKSHGIGCDLCGVSYTLNGTQAKFSSRVSFRFTMISGTESFRNSLTTSVSFLYIVDPAKVVERLEGIDLGFHHRLIGIINGYFYASGCRSVCWFFSNTPSTSRKEYRKY